MSDIGSHSPGYLADGTGPPTTDQRRAATLTIGGAVVGALLTMRLSRLGHPLLPGACGGVGFAIPLCFLPIDQPAYTVGAIMVVSGLFIPLLNAPLLALLSTQPPEHLRAQVMTFLISTNQAAGPAAFAVAGVVIASVGLQPVQIALAVAATCCAMLLITIAKSQGVLSNRS